MTPAQLPGIIAGFTLMFAGPINARAESGPAQSFADPAQWHPIIYTDLATITPGNAAYAELWAKDLAENDRAYGVDGRAHAPATESHIVVRGTDKIAVLTILDTTTACSLKQVDPVARLSVKLCPLKTAVYVGHQVAVTSGRKGCILESLGQSTAASGTFVGYDIASRTFRIGTLVNHQIVPGCSASIPLDDRVLP